MKAALAALVALSLMACFPHNAKHRRYAKIGEGAALATGIGLLYFAGSGADCDQMRTVGDETSSSCRGNADLLSGVGLGLILAGLTGFIVTVSTSPEDKPVPAALPMEPIATPPVGATTAPAAKSSE